MLPSWISSAKLVPIPEKEKYKQYATTSNKGNQRPKYLQNCDEKLDMGKHPFILVTN